MPKFKKGDVVRVVEGPKSQLGKLALVYRVTCYEQATVVEIMFNDAHLGPCYTAGMEWSYEKAEVPNPGSDDALDVGCTCPVLDNAHGKGHFMGGSGVFAYDTTCPVHGNPIENNEDSAREDK